MINNTYYFFSPNLLLRLLHDYSFLKNITVIKGLRVNMYQHRNIFRVILIVGIKIVILIKGGKQMANNNTGRNRIVVPEARAALNQMKLK